MEGIKNEGIQYLPHRPVWRLNEGILVRLLDQNLVHDMNDRNVCEIKQSCEFTYNSLTP